jgi:hypothetical protein
MVVHELRHEQDRQSQAPGRTEIEKLVLRDLRAERTLRIGAPLRHEAVEADRIDDGAGQDVRPDLRTFLHDHDGDVGALFGGELLDPYGGGKTGRAGADHDHIEVHGLPFRQIHRALLG